MPTENKPGSEGRGEALVTVIVYAVSIIVVLLNMFVWNP